MREPPFLFALRQQSEHALQSKLQRQVIRIRRRCVVESQPALVNHHRDKRERRGLNHAAQRVEERFARLAAHHRERTGLLSDVVLM